MEIAWRGRTALGVGSLAPAIPGKLNGGSAYYSDIAPSYPCQTEHKLEMALEYDVQSLDELERQFLEETIELTKDQNKEEDKENARHRERLRDVQEQFQHKMTKLRAKQAKNREEFLRIDAQLRYRIPAVSTFSPYQYGESGGSLPSASARSTSNYNERLVSSRTCSAYVDPIPQIEGSYEARYEKVYDQISTESLQSLRSNAFDTYAEASYSPGPTSFSSKQGYDKSGYEKAGYEGSNVYKKSQLYDTKSYSYGTSSQYPAYG